MDPSADREPRDAEPPPHRFEFRQIRLPLWVAAAVTAMTAGTIAGSGMLFHPSPVAPFLAGLLAWLAVRVWARNCFLFIDAQRGLIYRRDLRWHVLQEVGVLDLRAASRLRIQRADLSWWKALAPWSSGPSEGCELAAQTADGEVMPIWRYGAGQSAQAMTEGLHLSQWLGIPLVEDIMGELRQVGHGDAYLGNISSNAPAQMPARPAGAKAACEVGEELTIRPPAPRLRARHVLIILAVTLVTAGLAALLALSRGRRAEQLLPWAAIGGALACASFAWSLVWALRRREMLAAGPDGLTLHVRAGSKEKELHVEPEDLVDIRLVANVGPVDHAALWLGRQGLCITHGEESAAFGLGLERDELLWIKQAIEWTLSSRPMEDLAQAAAGQGPRMTTRLDDEAAPSRSAHAASPAGPSIRRTVRVSVALAVCYLAAVSGTTAAWLSLRTGPASAPLPPATTQPSTTTRPAHPEPEEFREIRQLLNDPRLKRIEQAKNRAAREGRPWKQVLAEMLREQADTQPATSTAPAAGDGGEGPDPTSRPGAGAAAPNAGP